MALAFPPNPAAGQMYTAEGITYVYSGDRWLAVPSGDQFVPKTGGAMTGPLTVPAGAAGQQVPQAQEVVKKTGDVMTGPLRFANGRGIAGELDAYNSLHFFEPGVVYFGNSSNTTQQLHGAWSATGPISLPSDPSDALQAATKSYVDKRTPRRILNVSDYIDANQYDSTTTTSYGASGPFGNYYMVDPASTVWVDMVGYFSTTCDAGVDDVGFQARLYYYDDTQYIVVPFHNGAVAIVRTVNVDATGGVGIRGQFMHSYLITPQLQRVPGQITLRSFFSNAYPGSTSVFSHTYWRFMEVAA